MSKFKSLENYVVLNHSKLLNFSIQIKLLTENYKNFNQINDFDSFFIVFKTYKAALFNSSQCWVDMDLLINADVVLMRNNHPNITYNENFTFKLNIEVNENISAPKIIDCYIGDNVRGFKKKDSLSKSLIPYIYKENYEEIAKEFISHVIGDEIELSAPIPIQYILNKMNIKVVKEKLDNDKKGFFVFIENNNYSENTIVINSDLCNNSLPLENETIVHELIHYYLHHKHVNFMMLTLKENFIDVQNVDLEKIDDIGYDSLNDRDILELQCANITPYLLIPHDYAIIQIETLIKLNKLKYNNLTYPEIFDISVKEFAKVFCVTEKMAKISHFLN